MSAYSSESASTSAFVQQRVKIKPEAFETVFRSFSNNISCDFTEDMRILAIDGSAMQIATNLNDADSFFPGTNGQKPYNLLHLNALYDLKHHIYIDAVIQKAKLRNEHEPFIDMVDRSDSKTPSSLRTEGMNLITIWRMYRKKAGNFSSGLKTEIPELKAVLIYRSSRNTMWKCI